MSRTPSYQTSLFNYKDSIERVGASLSTPVQSWPSFVLLEKKEGLTSPICDTSRVHESKFWSAFFKKNSS